MDNSNLNYSKPKLIDKPQIELEKSTAKKVPVIIVNLAYDVCTSISDQEEPVLMYNIVEIEGFTDGHGNIEFPEDDVIQQQIEKAMILRHKLKRFNLAKSYFSMLCNYGLFGPHHDFSDSVICHYGEISYYLVLINDIVNRRYVSDSAKASNCDEIMVYFQCSHCNTSCEIKRSIPVTSFTKAGIIDELSREILKNNLAHGIRGSAHFQTMIDSGLMFGTVKYSGLHSLSSPIKYYPGEDKEIVQLAYAALKEFVDMYNNNNEEVKWYQMI